MLADTRAAEKQKVARAAAQRVEPGMRVGLGSGSTARLFVECLGRRVANGLALELVVATSRGTEEAARAAGLHPVPMDTADAPLRLDLTVDGADEVDPALRLLKGGGHSLLREKIVAQMADRMVVMIDASKRVGTLGAFGLPIEVVPFAYAATAAMIETVVGGRPRLRLSGNEPKITDNGNVIVDCPPMRIAEPEALAAALTAIPGVVEHGLFLNEATEVLCARGETLEAAERPR